MSINLLVTHALLKVTVASDLAAYSLGGVFSNRRIVHAMEMKIVWEESSAA